MREEKKIEGEELEKVSGGAIILVKAGAKSMKEKLRARLKLRKPARDRKTARQKAEEE